MRGSAEPRELKMQKVRTLVIDEVKVKGPGINNSDMVIYKTGAKKALPFDFEGDEGYTRVTDDMRSKKSMIQTDIDKLSNESRENDNKLLDDISSRLRELGVVVADDEKLQSSGQTVKAYSYQKNGLPIIKSQSKYSHQNDDYMYDDDYDFSSSNVASIRSKAVDTKSSHHSDITDRYLSGDMGANHGVRYDIGDKYNQVATRMPDLDSYQIHHDPFEQPQPTVKPYSPALRPKEDPREMEDRQKHYLGRPPVSDIRKNCRSVICKSHGDPRWYSY